MWKIVHKCNPGQPDSEFALLKMERGGQKFTRVRCTDRECKEEFFVLGHEMFDEAVEVNESNSRHSSLPPGFIIPRSVRGN